MSVIKYVHDNRLLMVTSAQDRKMQVKEEKEKKGPLNRLVIPFILLVPFLWLASCLHYSVNAVDSPATDTTDTNIKGSSSI